MATAAITGLGTALMSNPQGFANLAQNVPGRRIAKGAIRGWGNWRGARQQNGKWFLGKRMSLPANRRSQPRQRRPRQANTVSNTAVTYRQQPAAINATMNTRSRNYTITKRERCKYGVNVEKDGGGQLINFAIHPQDPTVFPTLSGMCGNYTQFKFDLLTFEYCPTTGTQTDGVVTMGWDPQPHEEGDDDFQDPTVVASLPRNATGNVRQSLFFPIPISRPKYLVVPSNTSADPLNYFHGHFAMTTQGPADKDDVGALYVTYSVTLMGPKLNTTPKAVAGLIDGTSIHDPVHMYSGDISSTGFHLDSSTPLIFLMIGNKSGGATDATLEVDGTPIVGYHLQNTVTGNSVSAFPLPALGRQSLIELSTDCTTGGWVAFPANGTHFTRLMDVLLP